VLRKTKEADSWESASLCLADSFVTNYNYLCT
jgi:hypothetical protein